MTGLLRAELVKITASRYRWLLPVLLVVMSVLVNGFGGVGVLLTATLDERVARWSVLVSLGYSQVLAGAFAVVAGIVLAGAEFRHGTIATGYLITPARTPVLMAKVLVSGALGALCGLVAVLVGLPVLLAGKPSPALVPSSPDPVSLLPDAASLLLVTVVGTVVCALWGAFGAALAVLVGDQVRALVGALGYLLVAEPVLSAVVGMPGAADRRRSGAIDILLGILPGNAGDVAVLAIPDAALDYTGPAPVLTVLTTLAERLPWPAALLALAGWTALVVALAAVRGGNRDITGARAGVGGGS
jgi:ABC-2 type transport system permease protein